MRYGIIDIGSNSVRLLVADYDGKTHIKQFAEKETTRLIEGMREGNIAPDALNRTKDAILSLYDKAWEMDCAKIFCFGTAALRRARNAEILQKNVFTARGLSIDIISGEDEALLAYLGVNREGGVVDIGGGSTEIILGQGNTIEKAASLPMGAVVFMERSKNGASLHALTEEARSAVQALRLSPAPFSGIGGTILTAAAMTLKMRVYDSEIISKTVLHRARIEQLQTLIARTPLSKRANIPGLEPKRADIIEYGLAILAGVMDGLHIDRLSVSDEDNLIGYLRWRLK